MGDEEEGAAKCLSNPIFFRLVRYPFTRGEFDPVENYRDSYLGSNDNEPRSFFPYVIARPMTFSLRKWLQRSLRYETIRLRQLFQQRYVAVLRRERTDSNRPSLSSEKEFAGMLFASRRERDPSVRFTNRDT